MQEKLSENPVFKAAYEQYLSELTNIAETLSTSQSQSKKKAVVTIPLVFHVIHNYGEENISREQILDQVRILNEDFRRQNADASKTRAIFKSRAVDVEVEFKLVTKDPNGNCTDGITRTVSHLTYGGDDEVKKIIRWDVSKYLNIWVINNIGITPSTGGEVLGYAQFPFDDDKTTDGIVVTHRFVGSIGTSDANNAGRTLTHEVGHWLGLFHPFQNSTINDDCGGSNCATSGDRVCDTPPVLKASFGCPLGNNSCTNDSPDELDNVENYMDYGNGSCLNMFTAGQKNVINFYLGRTDYRATNISASTLSSTGVNISNPCAPIADFQSEDPDKRVCIGGSVIFLDRSWNGLPTDRVWTFEGGSPSTSTFANPAVVYNQAGFYKVTLKVINAKGESEISKTQYIEVFPSEANIKSPLYESFEGEFSPFYWHGETAGPFGWKILEGNGMSKSKALVCVISDETQNGQVFELISPPIDMTLHQGLDPKLSMRVAYSLRETSAGERLIIYGSDDCGESWKALRAFIGATTLASVSGNNPGFSPSNNGQYRVLEVNLNQQGFASSKNLFIKFLATSSSGNSIYIDDVNIDQFVLSTPTSDVLDGSVQVYPNPSDGTFTMNITGITDHINIEVSNALGQKFFTLEVDSFGELQSLPFELKEPGVYFVRLSTSTGEITKRVIVTQ